MCSEMAARMTSKGQITVPKAVRDALGLESGDVVYFRVRGEDALLASCYRKSLNLAVQHGLKTIAFPAISTGAYGFPMERATRIALTEAKRFLASNPSIDKVIFVCFDEENFEIYRELI